jgi:hypothetical protein
LFVPFFIPLQSAEKIDSVLDVILQNNKIIDNFLFFIYHYEFFLSAMHAKHTFANQPLRTNVRSG